MFSSVVRFLSTERKQHICCRNIPQGWILKGRFANFREGMGKTGNERDEGKGGEGKGEGTVERKTRNKFAKSSFVKD